MLTAKLVVLQFWFNLCPMIYYFNEFFFCELFSVIRYLLVVCWWNWMGKSINGRKPVIPICIWLSVVEFNCASLKTFGAIVRCSNASFSFCVWSYSKVCFRDQYCGQSNALLALLNSLVHISSLKTVWVDFWQWVIELQTILSE